MNESFADLNVHPILPSWVLLYILCKNLFCCTYRRSSDVDASFADGVTQEYYQLHLSGFRLQNTACRCEHFDFDGPFGDYDHQRKSNGGDIRYI